MEFQLQHQSFQRTLRTDFLWDGLVGSPCHPRDCQKSHPVAKVLEFQLQHQSFQRTLRTDLFRVDWLGLLTGQGTLKSLLQHYSSKASILWCSALFIVQLSHPYMTTRKIIALPRQIFVSKVNVSAF